MTPTSVRWERRRELSVVVVASVLVGALSLATELAADVATAAVPKPNAGIRRLGEGSATALGFVVELFVVVACSVRFYYVRCGWSGDQGSGGGGLLGSVASSMSFGCVPGLVISLGW